MVQISLFGDGDDRRPGYFQRFIESRSKFIGRPALYAGNTGYGGVSVFIQQLNRGFTPGNSRSYTESPRSDNQSLCKGLRGLIRFMLQL